jgi:hypothetical protein
MLSPLFKVQSEDLVMGVAMMAPEQAVKTFNVKVSVTCFVLSFFNFA